MTAAIARAIDQGVASDSSLHGGEPILLGTATTVRAVVELWQQGLTAEEIPVRIPHLSLSQVLEALHYYLGHPAEIDQWIAENRIPDEWAGKRFDPATRQVR